MLSLSPPSVFLQRFYKKAAAFVLRAVGKHSPQLAQAIVDCGALDTLVICLEDFDPGVKEAASWALGYIARHNAGNRDDANIFACRTNFEPSSTWQFILKVQLDSKFVRLHQANTATRLNFSMHLVAALAT